MPLYSREFKERALEMVESTGRSVNSIAKELGVSETAIRNWKQQIEIREAAAEGTAAQELSQAKKRIQRLEMEREILKKAVAFFARENG